MGLMRGGGIATVSLPTLGMELRGSAVVQRSPKSYEGGEQPQPPGGDPNPYIARGKTHASSFVCSFNPPLPRTSKDPRQARRQSLQVAPPARPLRAGLCPSLSFPPDCTLLT